MSHIGEEPSDRPKHSTKTMSSATANNDDGERQIPEHIIRELRESGASDLFLKVIQTPTSEVPGVERNSARQEVLKYMDWGASSNKNVSNYLHYGGGYFQSLYNGNPDAHADPNNVKILNHVRQGTSTGPQNLLTGESL